MTKNKRLIIISVTGLIFITLSIFFDAKYNISGYPKRIMNTYAALGVTRKMILEFREKHQRYPTSLQELKKVFSMPHLYKEYLSDSNGSFREYNDLNGNGGWYYNHQTGELKVNLTRPVKEYLRFYIGKSRNEIPSSW